MATQAVPSFQVPTGNGTAAPAATPAAAEPSSTFTGGVDQIAQPGVNDLGDLGSKILPGQTGPIAHNAILRPDGKRRAAANEALTAKQLLTLYQDAFGEGWLTSADKKALGTLDNRKLAEYFKVSSSGTGGGNIVAGNLADKEEAKDELASEITLYVPGLTKQEILKTDARNIMGLPVSTDVSKTFEDGGYSIPVGTPLGTAIQTIDPTALFKKEGTNDQLKPAQAGQITAAEAYNNLIGSYNSSSKTVQDQMIQQLANARYLNTDKPTAAQVQTAYKDLISQSVKTGESPANILATNPTSSQQAAEIDEAADKMGVVLSQSERDKLVEQATAASTPWTSSQVSEAVSGYFNFSDPTKLTGTAADLYAGFQKIANDYQIPISQLGLGQWVTNAIKGVDYADPDESATTYSTGSAAADAGFTAYVQGQAAAMYPQFATQIKQGITTNTLLDPYAQVAASVLGFGSVSGTGNSVSAAAQGDASASLNIDWSKPQWQKALQGGTNPDTGGPAPMSLDQWRSTLITDPSYGWAKTDDAKNMGAGIADHLLSVFGQPAAQGQ